MKTGLDAIKVNVDALQLMSINQARHYTVLPSSISEHCLTIYATDSLTPDQLLELKLIYGRPIEVINIDKETVVAGINKYYRNGFSSNMIINKLGRLSQVKIELNELLEEAHLLGASDIHLEPFQVACSIRFRIDGILTQRYEIPLQVFPSLVNRIKVRAGLDIAEKRVPQDGRISFIPQHDREIDVRVSTIPVLCGEKVVMRLLEKDKSFLELDRLGMTRNQLEMFKKGIQNKHGLVLICGPTGSGKTTSLYAAINLLNNSETNILTIEDPVEYTFKGINQVQLNEAIGLTFPKTLKSFLRQDPDVIMLGEIRDSETAEMAVRSSITGHLVMSSIHTNSAWGAIARLTDMGIPPYLLASTLRLLVSQRLVRLLCSDCKIEVPFELESSRISYTGTKELKRHFIPQGCSNCFHTGYSGRMAIYETIEISEKLSAMIRQNKHEKEAISVIEGHVSLNESAFKLFAEGKTSLNEVYNYLFSVS